MTAAHLEIDADALRPLVEQIVGEVLARVEHDAGPFAGKLAIGEAEAARSLSLKPHQLRDMRLRGEINATKGPAGRILYERDELIAYLARRRTNGGK